MTEFDVFAVLPFAVLGAAAVVTMLLAPLGAHGRVEITAAAGLGLASLIAAISYGVPARGLTAMMVDDPAARLGLVLAALPAMAALSFAPRHPQGREAPALIVLAVTGAAIVSAARDGTMLFLGLELMSLALVPLFAFPLGRRGLEAAYKYFLMSAAGAATLALGLGLLFAASGTLAFAGWSAGDALSVLGLVLVLAGLAFKFALAPFHMWSPDVFEGARPAGAVLVGIAAKVAVGIALLRLTAVLADAASLRVGLGLLGGASIVVGNVLALRQESLARMLGYSSVAHSGYVAAILGSGTPAADEAALFYLAGYTPALLVALAVLAVLPRARRFDSLRGTILQHPAEGICLALAMTSLMGLPPAVGFIGKVYLFSTLVEAQSWGLLIAAALGASLGFFYYGRFLAAPFLPPASDAEPSLRPRPGRITTAVLLVPTALVLIFGIYPAPLIAVASAAAPW